MELLSSIRRHGGTHRGASIMRKLSLRLGECWWIYWYWGQWPWEVYYLIPSLVWRRWSDEIVHVLPQPVHDHPRSLEIDMSCQVACCSLCKHCQPSRQNGMPDIASEIPSPCCIMQHRLPHWHHVNGVTAKEFQKEDAKLSICQSCDVSNSDMNQSIYKLLLSSSFIVSHPVGSPWLSGKLVLSNIYIVAHPSIV